MNKEQRHQRPNQQQRMQRHPDQRRAQERPDLDRVTDAREQVADPHAVMKRRRQRQQMPMIAEDQRDIETLAEPQHPPALNPPERLPHGHDEKHRGPENREQTDVLPRYDRIHHALHVERKR